MYVAARTRMLLDMTAIKASLLIIVVAAGVFGTRVETAPAQSMGEVELFVSPGGRDSWPGTKSHPFATLERARRAVRARRTALGRGLPGKAIRVPAGYACRSTAPQSWQHPEDIELVFNGGEKGLPYSEARCGVSRIRRDAKWSLISVDQPCWRDLKRAYGAEVKGATPAAPTDVENSLSLSRRPGTAAAPHWALPPSLSPDSRNSHAMEERAALSYAVAPVTGSASAALASLR